jgi:ankyrin repeat protein
MQARYEFKLEIVEVIRQAAGQIDIFEAAALGDIERLRELLSSEPELAKAYSNDGFTALQFACFFGQPEAVKELSARGSDMNAVSRNTMHVAVINTAAASQSVEIVKIVLGAGARPDHQQQAGYTALHEAAAHNDAAMAQALLDAGATRDIRSDDGKTAADIATEKGYAALASLLKNESGATAAG